MKRFAKAINRVGQKAVKFNLFVKVFKVSVPTPAARAKVPKGSQVSVELENKKRVDSTSDHDVDEEIWDDDAVQVSVTLFRDAKGKYQPKPFTLKLRNVGGKKDVLATFIVDAAQFASLGTAGAGTSSKTCTLTALPKDSPVKDLMLKVTIGCTFLRESTGDDDTSTVLTDGDDQNDAGGGGGRGAEQDLDGFDNDQQLDGFDEAAEDAYDEDEPLGKSSDGVDQDALLSEALGDAGGGGHDEEEDFDDGKIDSLLDDVDMLLAGGGSADDAQGPPPATMTSEIRENGKFPLPKSPALSSAQDTIALLQGLASGETSPSNGSSSSLRGAERAAAAAAAAAAELDGIEGGSGDAALGGSLSETDHAIEAEANKVRCELEQQLILAEEEERRKQQAAVKELLGELAKLQDENAKLSTRATEAEKRAAEVASVCRALKKRAKDLEGDLDVAKEDSVAKDKLQELLAAKEVEVGGLASALVSAGVKQQAAETAKARADSRATEAETSRAEAEAGAESSRQQAAEAARQQRHAVAAAEVKVQEAEAEVERAKAAEAAAARKATAAETAATERVSEMDIELEAQKTDADAKVRAAHTKAAQLKARVAEVQALASSQAGEQLGSNSAAQAAALAAASSKTGAFEEAVAVLEAHVETLKSDAAAAARKAKAALATAAARVTELEAEEDSARRTAAKDKNAAAAKATALEAQVGELEAAVRDGERALQQQQRTHAAALQQAEAKLEAAKGEEAAALEEVATRARTEMAKQQAELKEALTAQAEANAKEAKAENSAQNKKVGKAGGAVVDELVTSLRAQLELITGSLSSAKAEAAELKVVAKQGLEEQGRGHAVLVQQLQQQILGLEAELDETAARGEARAAELQWKLLEMAGQNQALEDKASQDEAAKEAARSAGTQGQAALEAALETSGGAQREAEGKLQRCEELLASTRVRAEAAESSTAVAEARGAEKARRFERLAAEAGSVAAAAERCAELEAQVESLTANASASAEAEANATAAVMAMAARAEGNAREVAGLAFSLEMVAGKARKALRAIAKEPQGEGTGNGDGSTGAEEGSSSNGSAAAAAARAALEHLKSAQQRQQQQEEEQGASGVGFSAAAAAAGLATEAVAALADVSLRVRGEWFEASTALEERVAKGGELHAAALAAEQAVETGHASAKIHAQAKDKEVVARLQEQIKRLKAEVEDVSSAAEPLELELGALRTELLEAEIAITDAVASAKTDAAREHRELQQRAEALEAKLALAEKALQDQQASNGLDEGFGSTGGGLSAVEFRVQASQALLSGNAAKLAESSKARKLLLGNSARQLEAVQAQSAARELASRAVAPPPKRPPPEETSTTPAAAAPATPKEEAPATSPPAAERVQQAEASACGLSGDEVQATQGLSSNGLSGVRCTSCNTVLELSEAASHVCGEAEARASTAEEPPPPSSTDDDVPSTRRSESRFSVSGMASYFNKT